MGVKLKEGADGMLLLDAVRGIAHPGGADPGKIGIVYCHSFSSGAGGWGGDASANLLVVALNSFSFNPYGSAIAHEIGHCLTVQDKAKMDDTDLDRKDHYPNDRTGPRDERLHLVAAGGVTGGIVNTILNLECIWDDPDSRGYNWYKGMRTSGLLK